MPDLKDVREAPGSIGTIQPELSVAALLVRRPAASPWIEHTWSVAGVVAGEGIAELGSEPALIRSEEGESHFLVGGLRLALFPDECESYYYNLISDHPAVYLVCREESERPEPFLATLSYDEASSYIEGGDSAYPVAMPPEVYRWLERYVLEHYVPEKRLKRKRDNWKDQGR